MNNDLIQINYLFQTKLIEYFKNIQHSENEQYYRKCLGKYINYGCFGSCNVCPIKTVCTYYDPDHTGGVEDETILYKKIS